MVEFHTWGSAARADWSEPDRVVFDLDPGEGIAWREVVEAAVHVRGELEALGLVPFVKTTGGKGMHVVVPMTPKLAWKRCTPATGEIAARIAAAAPDTFTTTMGAANRKRRIFIDFHRNARSATAVAPYSLRARNNLPASAPAELGGSRKHRRSGGFELFFAPGPGGGLRRPLGGHRRLRPGPAGAPQAGRANRRRIMAPRASWKGYLKLSLVSCPVRLYPATSASERVSFNQLHKDTHNRINMKPVDPELGLVERSDLVQGLRVRGQEVHHHRGRATSRR